MRKRQSNLWAAVFLSALFVLTTGTANAQSDASWTTIATRDAGGDSHEIAVNRKISKVVITCLSGTVKIHSIDVVHDNKTFAFKVGNELKEKQSQQVSVGNSLMCSSFVIHDSGAGRYEIKVKE